ncbi:MAG: 3-oxoadipyl-CoA thiolase [Acidimicrobiia bacterium]|nr:3-oxoadipyl-CoA thiolase [Acidimicrobiia bacterium]NNL14440.1 3-oxoadipyl-CoA thiolase [Acidimicrobiia bacterium]
MYIVDYVRTPIGRYGGGLAPVRTDDLAAEPIAGLMRRNGGVDWGRLDDVILGCTNQAGEDNRNVGRMAGLLSGLPVEVPGTTVNRLCGSGMDAVVQAARAIGSGAADLIVAGGVESMSRAPHVIPKPETAYARTAEIVSTTLGWRLVNPLMEALGHTESLGVTAENVAEEYGVSREDQDAFALRSQQRTAAATEAGRLAEEILPVAVPQRRGDDVVVERDEHPRTGTTLEKLAALPPAFREGGTVTAGNSSGLNDGAAGLLVASEKAVAQYDLTPLAVVGSSTVAGVPPRIMGIGPVPATRKLLATTGLDIGDFGVVELNEAFASQSLACLRELGLPDDAEFVNPNGGAIALGHPTGMSGARLVGTAVLEMNRRSAHRALATMCIGVGQGIALELRAV